MSLPTITIRQLIENGVHFGHNARRWNPKMGPYIYGVREGVHILDLTQTQPMLTRALQAVRDFAAKGGKILFVGTKMQAQEAIADAEKRKIKDQLYLFSTGGNVDEIKKFITGNNGKQRPMPVAIGVYCLNSWSCSPFTRKTGWFNMPVCDEIKLLVFKI